MKRDTQRTEKRYALFKNPLNATNAPPAGIGRQRVVFDRKAVEKATAIEPRNGESRAVPLTSLFLP